MENEEIPKVLIDVAILQAKVDAMEGLMSNFIKKIAPDDVEVFMGAYEKFCMKKVRQYLYEIPQVDQRFGKILKSN